MAPLAELSGVAIAGRLYTANLGIEKVVANVTGNPSIRYLVVCGRESPFFQAGQALQSLWERGVTPKQHIIGAQGHLPEISRTQATYIECFRKQVELVNCIGETDVDKLATTISDLVARHPGPFVEKRNDGKSVARPARVSDGEAERGFKALLPGGRREPLAYDPKGFFIIGLDRQAGDIIVRHYLPDNTPAHIMRGRHSEAVLLGLLREDLISQMSHAGYLGAELIKAETALRLGLHYEQDQPLRPGAEPSD
jgi:tetrahydromethanopterin S-methyltransferase subunit A